MTVITEDVAARLRRRGYDATHGRWETIHGATETTDFVVVNAVTVIGWRYPDGDWLWDDRPAYLVDKGVDPLRRSAQQPYFNTSHRWEWLPSRPNAPEEHPRDSATATQLSRWIIKRLPPPTRPICVLYHHPDDHEHNPDLAVQIGAGIGPTTWPWTSDWEKAWAAADQAPS
jgi:hypothetical protein